MNGPSRTRSRSYSATRIKLALLGSIITDRRPSITLLLFSAPYALKTPCFQYFFVHRFRSMLGILVYAGLFNNLTAFFESAR